MRYLKYFEGRYTTIDLSKIVLKTSPYIGSFKYESSIGRAIYAIYDKLTIGHLIYYYFDKEPHTEELKGLFNNEIYINYVETQEAFRENGLANLMLKEMIRQAKDLNVDAITLKRSGASDSNYNLYLKRQYKKVGFMNLNEFIITNPNIYKHHISSNKMIMVLKNKD